MPFVIKIDASDSGSAASKIDGVQASLEKTTAAADKTRDSVTKLGKDGADAGTMITRGAQEAAGGYEHLTATLAGLNTETDKMKRDREFAEYKADLDARIAAAAALEREAEILERIQGPIREYKADLNALDSMLRKGTLTQTEYSMELDRLTAKQNAMQGGTQMNGALEREATILERIRGPIREYKADLDALDVMLRKGTLTQSEYSAEMDRLIKKQGTMQGPKQDLSAPASQSTGINLTSAVGAVAAGVAVVALTRQLESLVQGMFALSDASIQATNAAQKFVDAGHDVGTVMREQVDVAARMHASYDATIALYNKVREGSEGVALSHREQLQLTETLGQAVQLSNKPVEEAAALMSKFGFAMQTGTIQARELRSMMREVPAIAEIWRDKFHATNAELMDMSKQGTLTVQSLVTAIVDSSDRISAKFGNIKKTHAEMMQEFSDRAKVVAAGGWMNKIGDYLDRTTEAQNEIAMPSLATDTIGVQIDKFISKADDARAAVERLNQADMHGIAQELEKLNDPAAKAQVELTALNKAFGIGGVDIDQYNKELLKLQTTINHGIASEGLKINIPIADAKKSLDSLNKAFSDSEITYAQYEKRRNELSTTILGVLPEADKIATPIDEARRALADLNVAIKQHRINSEEARIETDRLMTTINDGRLPETIKWWESFHLPLEQFRRDTAALDGLLRRNAITWSDWRASMEKAAAGAGTNGEIWKLLQGVDDMNHRKPYRPDNETNAFAVYDAQVKQQSSQDLIGEKTIEPARVYMQALQGVQVAVHDLGLSQQAATILQREARDQFDSTAAAVTKATASVEHYQKRLDVLSAKRNIGMLDDESFQAAVSQLDRAAKLIEETKQPLVTYKQAIDDIKTAVHDLALTQEYANNMTRRAKKAYEDAVDALDPVAKLIHDVTRGEKQYADGHRILDAALARTSGITLKQYNDELDKQRASYLANSDAGKTFAGGMEAEFLKLKAGADAFGATLAQTLVGDAGKLSDAFVTMANGGAVSWSSMVDSMIQDLERLILKQLEVKAVGMIEGAFGAVAGGVAGAASDSAAADATTSGIGASARVGAYPSSPGGYPTLAYPAPSQNTPAPTTTPAAAPIIQVHLSTVNPADVHAAMSTDAGSKVVLDILRRNGAFLRGQGSPR